MSHQINYSLVNIHTCGRSRIFQTEIGMVLGSMNLPLVRRKQTENRYRYCKLVTMLSMVPFEPNLTIFGCFCHRLVALQLCTLWFLV